MTERKTNNWDDLPWIQRQVAWRTGRKAPDEIYVAEVEGSFWTIRMNDFPDEPLYSLLVDGVAVFHFDDWPTWLRLWGTQPALP